MWIKLNAEDKTKFEALGLQFELVHQETNGLLSCQVEKQSLKGLSDEALKSIFQDTCVKKPIIRRIHRKVHGNNIYVSSIPFIEFFSHFSPKQIAIIHGLLKDELTWKSLHDAAWVMEGKANGFASLSREQTKAIYDSFKEQWVELFDHDAYCQLSFFFARLEPEQRGQFLELGINHNKLTARVMSPFYTFWPFGDILALLTPTQRERAFEHMKPMMPQILGTGWSRVKAFSDAFYYDENYQAGKAASQHFYEYFKDDYPNLFYSFRWQAALPAAAIAAVLSSYLLASASIAVMIASGVGCALLVGAAVGALAGALMMLYPISSKTEYNSKQYPNRLFSCPSSAEPEHQVQNGGYERDSSLILGEGG